MKEEYKKPASTVDLIVEKEKRILLIKRKHPPFQGCWAIPGGFLECDKETLEDAAIRELKEETNIDAKTSDIYLIGVYSNPNRDPRGHVISHVYVVTKYEGDPKAMDDAKELKWFSLDNLPKLAFDHNKIIQDYRGRDKNE
jgi:8-oxo-dGTP diphosphatase